MHSLADSQSFLGLLALRDVARHGRNPDNFALRLLTPTIESLDRGYLSPHDYEMTLLS
jgi:hypothetical protein